MGELEDDRKNVHGEDVFYGNSPRMMKVYLINNILMTKEQTSNIVYV